MRLRRSRGPALSSLRAVRRTRPRHHLQALSSRFPSSSVRSPRSPTNSAAGAIASSSDRSLPAYTFSSVPRSSEATCATSTGACPSSAPPEAAARFNWCSMMPLMRSISAPTGPAGAPPDRLARMTASGVFRLFARLPSAAEAPQLLLIGAEADGDAEGDRALAVGVVRELDRAALDGHAVVTEGCVHEVALSGHEQRAEIAGGKARRRRRAPQVTLRVDLR